MITEDGRRYVNAQRSLGISDEEIREALKSSGWQESDISELLRAEQSHTSQLEKPGDLLSRAFDFYKRNLDAVVKILLPGFIVMLIGAVLAPTGFEGHSSNQIFNFSHPVSTVISGALSVIQVVVSIFTSLALISFTAAEGALSPREAWINGSRYFLSYFWTGILLFLSILLGMLLFIIPGIIFCGWFIFAGIIVVTERLSGTKALMRSREYVRGRWWAIAGRMMFLGLVTFAAYFVFFLAVGVLQAVQPLPYVVSLLYSALTVILVPLSVFYQYRLYVSARQTAKIPTEPSVPLSQP